MRSNREAIKVRTAEKVAESIGKDVVTAAANNSLFTAISIKLRDFLLFMIEHTS